MGQSLVLTTLHLVCPPTCFPTDPANLSPPQHLPASHLPTPWPQRSSHAHHRATHWHPILSPLPATPWLSTTQPFLPHGLPMPCATPTHCPATNKSAHSSKQPATIWTSRPSLHPHVQLSTSTISVSSPGPLPCRHLSIHHTTHTTRLPPPTPHLSTSPSILHTRSSHSSQVLCPLGVQIWKGHDTRPGTAPVDQLRTPGAIEVDALSHSALN